MCRWSADAKAAGLITTCHTGGSSIPGSGAITGDHLLKMHPHVSFHINGGPTAMPDADFERVISESEIALQVCTAGNLRTTLLCARLAEPHDAFDRFIIATDTPTGSGIMPLGMLYTIAHLSSLTDMPPEHFICAATGSNAKVYGLDSGYLAPGKAADIVLHRRARWRHAGDCPCRHQARRYRGDRRRGHRRCSALRRPQPQYAGHHAQGARGGVARHARLFRHGSLARHRHAETLTRQAAAKDDMLYQQLINGLMLGASYSLVAIGYTLIFGVLNLLYFAHGEVFMVGAFVGLFIVTLWRHQYLCRAARRHGCLRRARRIARLRRGPAGHAKTARWRR